MFRVGQKVVCVDASHLRNPHLRHLSNGIIKEGRIYTVRGFAPSGMLWLDEIVSRPYRWVSGFHEGGWLPHRFRPIVERKTDISIFTEMLRRESAPSSLHSSGGLSMSFTPGPWKYIPSHIAEGPSEVRHADGWLICCTCSDEFARLIAAAPDLLDALRFVLTDPCFPKLGSITQDVVRLSISKAEGHIGQELAPGPERRMNGNANGDEK